MTPTPAKARTATKRKHRRFLVDQPALVTCADVSGSGWTARIANISRRGMQLILEHPAPLDSEVQVQWINKEVRGTVRYRQQRGAEYRVGVALSASCESLLIELLARETVTLRTIDQEATESAAQLRRQIREMTDSLAKASRASEIKSRFLASVSHEFRTPLNGIIGFSELLYDAKAGPVTIDQKDYLSDILICSRHLLTLINQVLDLTKIEAGKMDFQYETVDLEDIAREVMEGIKALAEEKHIVLKLECDRRIGTVRADAARLRQILFNYLSNALKFSPDGGRVVIRILAEEGARYRLVVEDNGLGIRAEDLPRLFSEFGQLGTARKVESGTGLGLAITRQIVEKQGGRVGVESTFGSGSRFWAVLPTDPTPV
jgi:signal transduction histidine kinase